MVAAAVKSSGPRHDAKGSAAQPGVELKDAGLYSHVAAAESGAKLLVQLDDPGAIGHGS